MKRLRKIAVGIISLLAVLYVGLVIVALLPQETTPINALSGPLDKFVTVNGQTLHYLKQGNGKPLILVHGFAGSTYTWRKLTPLLADRYTVYALDLLGFGLSDKPPDENYALESQGRLLSGFLEALHIPHAAIAGHSMGGVVAGFAALDAPSKVDELILISSGFYVRGVPGYLRYLFFPLDRLLAKQFYERSERAASLKRSFYNQALVTDELIDAYLLPAKTPHAVDALARMMKSAGIGPREGAAATISVPSLLIFCDHDANNLFHGMERVEKELKRSRFVTIKGCGHYIQEEKPEELARIIKEFLR